MPELPEVETTRRGIKQHVLNQTITKVISRKKKLRWPIPIDDLNCNLTRQKFTRISRRGKYLILHSQHGWLIIHLGMSGTLRIVPADTKPMPHDHFELRFENKIVLRLNDPRRFGAVLWESINFMQHPLIKNLGPEPLSQEFNVEWLRSKLKSRRASIKSLIMNNHLVTGVGNIYANESLFEAGLDPLIAGMEIKKHKCSDLVKAIKKTLKIAIKFGGSSLQDYVNPNGTPGYFQLQYKVYNRRGLPCRICKSKIIKEIHSQRATYFCKKCQR